MYITSVTKRIADYTKHYASPSHLAVAGALDGVCQAIRIAGLAARRELPGIEWDFGKLHEHFQELSRLVAGGLALKASQTHQQFCVPNPAVVLATKRRQPSPEHIRRRREYLGGKVSSEAKTAATRLSLELAREAKRAKRAAERDDVREARGKLKALRERLRILRYRAKAASAKRGPSVADEKRARKMEAVLAEIRTLEATFPWLRWGGPKGPRPIARASDGTLALDL